MKRRNNRELERINENKQLFVKEKIASCIQNRILSQNSYLDASLPPSSPYNLPPKSPPTSSINNNS